MNTSTLVLPSSLRAFVVLLLCVAPLAAGDEPAMLRKERWAALTEVQFGELKAAEDFFRAGKWTAARNAYEKFMTVHSRSEVATYCQLMMGESTLRAGKPNDAVSEFQFVRDLAPDSDDARWAHLRIAQCHRTAGNVERALAVFGEIWTEAGEHPTAFWAAVEQAGILEGQQKLAQRVPVWQGLVERFAKKPVDARAFDAAARGLAREKVMGLDLDGALELIRMTSGKGARKPGAAPADHEVELFGMARSVVAEPARKDQPAGAREKLAAAVAARADAWLAAEKERAGHQQVVADVVAVHLAVGQKDQAVARALEARKTWADARWTIEQAAVLYQGLGRVDDAIRQASDGRRLHAEADWALVLYAGLVLKKGDLEAALGAWDRMKDRVQGFTLSSEALLEAGKTDDAVARRRKIADLDGRQTSAVFMWAGKAYEKAGRYDPAIREYRQAATEPTNLYAIAVCLCKQNKHKEAIAQLGEIAAVFSDKDAPRAIYLMALEYEHVGDAKQAINLMRRVCRTYPRHPSASAAHARLESKYGIDQTLGGSPGEKKED